MMLLIDVVEQAILGQRTPLVTDYEVYLQARAVVRAGQWEGQSIKRLPKAWDASRTRQLLNRLNSRRFLAPDPDFSSGMWRVLQSDRSSPAAEAACIADPFCYVSDRSALDLHGLTIQPSATLQLTRPARPLWNAERDDRIATDVDQRELHEATSLFFRPNVADTLRRRPVSSRETRYPAQAESVDGARTRVASVGDAFANTLAEPGLCGGMPEVLQIWERHARAHLDPIIKAVNRTDAKIVKVRAGYILAERLDIRDQRIDAWRSCAQRGGSRRLDPDAPYKSVFSEDWMISLNVES
ncbi:hypothetical protein D3C72_1197070 [compost metagenome]